MILHVTDFIPLADTFLFSYLYWVNGQSRFCKIKDTEIKASMDACLIGKDHWRKREDTGHTINNVFGAETSIHYFLLWSASTRFLQLRTPFARYAQLEFSLQKNVTFTACPVKKFILQVALQYGCVQARCLHMAVSLGVIVYCTTWSKQTSGVWLESERTVLFTHGHCFVWMCICQLKMMHFSKGIQGLYHTGNETLLNRRNCPAGSYGSI